MLNDAYLNRTTREWHSAGQEVLVAQASGLCAPPGWLRHQKPHYPVRCTNVVWSDLAARADAIDETGLSEETFPSQCPFPVEQVLDATFWPD